MEAQRWPEFVTCPHCGGMITKMEDKSHRPGLYLCGDCRGNFSVTVGTVYERSHIPLHKWLLATHLMASSKKGISAPSCTASSGSPTSRLGSWPIASARE